MGDESSTAGSNTLLAVDPGTEQAGFARFEGSRLVQAELIKEKGSLKEYRAWRVAVRIGDLLVPGASLVVEHPQVYARSPGDPDDLLALSLVVGGVLALHKGGEIVRPREWKGQVPKNLMTARILRQLEPDERELCKKINDNHNVLDAVGIGLWKLKRFRSA